MQGLGTSTGSQGHLIENQQQQRHPQSKQHQQQQQQQLTQPPGSSPQAAPEPAPAPAATPAAAEALIDSAEELSLEHLPRFSSQHFWLHEQSAEADHPAGPLQGLANAVGAVMHGLLGGNAVSGPQAANQIAYPLDEEAYESGSESGSPTRQSLLRHNLSRFSGSSSGSASPLVSGAGGFGSNTVGRPSLFAPGLNRAASSSNPGSDLQRRSKSCSAAGSTQQQQQQQQEGGGEGSGPEGLRHTSRFQRSKNRWQSAAANVMQMNKVRRQARISK
jgi:hypothetical protein